MVQNGATVTGWIRERMLAIQMRGRTACLETAGVALLLPVAIATIGAVEQAPATTTATSAIAVTRATLTARLGQATTHLTRATDGAATPDDRRAARHALAEALETIDRESTGTGLITAPLRDQVRSTIAAVRDDRRDLDAASITALLARVRTAIDGEVALGLAFQGSYSQARVKEPVYGGHASAMGPAPAAPTAATADTSTPTMLAFHERPPVPTRTWNGGPTKDHILESPGNGVALVDVDGDGWLDIYLVTAAQLDGARNRIPHRNALYRTLGGWRFEDVSSAAGVDGEAGGNGVCAGDADGDGHVDLYVTNWGPNFLYRNTGKGRFEEIAAAAGVAAGGWSTGCTFVDVDADGDLDLYVARYVKATDDDLHRARRTLRWRNGPAIMVGPAGLPGEPDLFFENLGGGRFREATAAHGLTDAANAYGFGVVATDVDDDGAVDLFVANDSNPNFLYRNLGNGRFDSVGVMAGVAVNGEARAQAGMGVDAGDTDGDGRIDLVLTAFAHDRNTLYRNLGAGLFEDAALPAGLATSTFQRMGWGVALLDADLDGRQDLFIANGHIFADVGDFPALGERFAQKNQILLNTGGAFRDVSALAGPGMQVEKVSRGLAVGDLDNDGDPDVVISNMDDVPTLLENRQTSPHHWVAVQLSSPTGNRLAIGAKVTVTAGAMRQVREVRSGSSFMSQGDLRVQVGVGAHTGPVDVEVRMPGGSRWIWRGLAVDRLHALSLTPDARVQSEGVAQ